MSWRVFWVPSDAVRGGVRGSVVEGWDDLPSREDAVGVLAGDPIFLSPDHRVDPLLGLYGQSGTFRRHEDPVAFRDELRLVAWTMINGELRPTFLAERATISERLRDHAERLRGIADGHDCTRITLMDRTP
ncbi:hypothetical protein [Streptomyces sp. AC550_RSS872]|uniref:hypothetical protein n=1 Tax=Streptomyces sp. AC550_RSS872 TaxID=2823689 RepID=UPI001C266EDC|nr:hypothetical protein [Streptomyces sp. AC550_RSS872]